MPKISVDYQKNVIYKIVCNDLNILDLYVGSTICFTKRKNQHKSTCNDSKLKAFNQPKYKIIRNNGGWDNWNMIEIEKYPCNDGNEARTRERYWFEQLNSTLNDRKPFRTLEEKREYNISYITENKIILDEKRKVYNNKDAIKLHKNIRQKQYYIDNKEHICELQKAKKNTCECGSIYRSHDRAQHIKNKKHQEYIKL